MSKKTTAESEKSDKSDKSDKPDKALFVQRLIAFIVDVFLVSMVASFVTVPFVDSESLTRLNDSLTEVQEKYLNQEIDDKVYFTESMSLTYQMNKKNGIVTLVTLFLEILYFIVFQFKNNGQTIGKQLMKIRVVSMVEEMTINQMLFRSLIIDSILVDMIIFGFVVFASQSIYIYGTLIFVLIQYAVIFSSIMMMIFSKSGRGLHDLISYTEVVKEN